MHWLHRDKRKNQRANAPAWGTLAESEAIHRLAHQRPQARAKMVLYCLNDRMRVFGPMMMRVLSQIESEQKVVVIYPKTVAYGNDDPYFPTYEWQILPKSSPTDSDPDPRKLTVALRASPGDNLSEIMVYYLVTYIDWHGDEHALHRLPTDFRNEIMIKTLLLDGIQSAGLTTPPNPNT